MCKIAILLATYNSALYLADLLESIINQSIEDWQIYIIDDGSADTTLSIIREYVAKNSKIIFVENTHLHNGPKNNFMYLLSVVSAEYYMFCDHDDVWLPTKIEESLARMIYEEEQNLNKAIIVHSDLCVVDSHLNIISTSFFTYASINPRILLSSIWHLAHSNCVVGCTMFFNNQAKSISFPISKYALMHDSWISLKVLAFGGIVSCIYKPLILYRQHASNTLGAVTKDSSFSLAQRVKGNWKQYLMARDATGVGVFNFIIHRLIYLHKR